MKIKLLKGGYMPTRAHETDAGIDFRYPFADETLLPGCAMIVPLRVCLAIPAGYFGKFESKSGLMFNHDIVCPGGVVDSGFRGEVQCKLINTGGQPYEIKHGDKIVQMVIMKCETPDFEVVDVLDDTERGEGGFGSTGR